MLPRLQLVCFRAERGQGGLKGGQADWQASAEADAGASEAFLDLAAAAPASRPAYATSTGSKQKQQQQQHQRRRRISTTSQSGAISAAMQIASACDGTGASDQQVAAAVAALAARNNSFSSGLSPAKVAAGARRSRPLNQRAAFKVAQYGRLMMAFKVAARSSEAGAVAFSGQSRGLLLMCAPMLLLLLLPPPPVSFARPN